MVGTGHCEASSAFPGMHWLSARTRVHSEVDPISPRLMLDKVPETGIRAVGAQRLSAVTAVVATFERTQSRFRFP